MPLDLRRQRFDQETKTPKGDDAIGEQRAKDKAVADEMVVAENELQDERKKRNADTSGHEPWIFSLPDTPCSTGVKNPVANDVGPVGQTKFDQANWYPVIARRGQQF